MNIPQNCVEFSHYKSTGNRAFRRAALACAGIGAMLASGALAQTGPSPDSGNAAEPEIFVTAQKREERLQKVPISIAVLSGKTLDKQPSGGTLEALLQVPAISQTNNDAGNLTQVTIRGVAPGVPSGAGGPTTGYYIDAVPFALIRAATVPNTNSYDMARIEVLRGPQGTLYGASALNGVIRIITNDADPSKFEFKARGGVATTSGGDPSFRADTAINIPLIEDKLALRAVADLESIGGWVNQPARNKKNANSALNRSLRFKLAALPSDDLRIDLGAWFERDQWDSGDYSDKNGNQLSTVAQPGKTKFNLYSGKITYNLPFMSISSSTGYLDFDQPFSSDFSYVTGYTTPIQLNASSPTKVFTEELLFNSAGSGSWRWSAGAFYRNARGRVDFVVPGLLPGPLYSRDSSESYAAFGQITRTFADDTFELTGGLRYFHDTSTTEVLSGGFLPAYKAVAKFNKVTPRLTLTWLPSPAFTAYLSYSQGFRSGLNQGALALAASPGLLPAKADTLNNYEVGAKGTTADGLLSFDAAVYYIKWNDVQQLGQILYNGAYTPAVANGPSASGMGTDLTLTLHPAAGFQLGGSIGYSGLKLDADIVQETPYVVLAKKGDRTANSPAWTGSVFANYTAPLSDSLDGRLNISATYRSEVNLRISQSNDNGVAAAVYSSGKPLIVNANFDISTHDNKTFSVYVQNLTNWNGLTSAPAVESLSFRPRPRTIGVQFEAKF
ncbi:TonB-dependent receptor [Sphingobium amiense]|uniref:TonB-dependent receptor n=1 Tax=Sphingobium amiense TaxID=135719 RepID=UPI00082E7DEC|nr:TonB-dependent receptor [Sphingobium amiense]